MFFTPYRLYHKPPLRGGTFWAAVSPLEKLGWLARPGERVASMVARREVKEDAPSRPKQMVAKVSSSSSVPSSARVPSEQTRRQP